MNINGPGAGVRVVQVLGLTSCAFLCGKTFSNSFSTAPALLLAPAPLLAKQWRKMFDSDKALAPAVVLFSGGVFGYLASKSSFSHTGTRLYTASASLLALCIPYSYFALEPVNKKLETKTTVRSVAEASGELDQAQEQTVHSLVDRWATVNLGRTVLTGAAAILATWAAAGSASERLAR